MRRAIRIRSSRQCQCHHQCTAYREYRDDHVGFHLSSPVRSHHYLTDRSPFKLHNALYCKITENLSRKVFLCNHLSSICHPVPAISLRKPSRLRAELSPEWTSCSSQDYAILRGTHPVIARRQILASTTCLRLNPVLPGTHRSSGYDHQTKNACIHSTKRFHDGSSHAQA